MSLLGDRAWWLPRWLDRTLPSVNLDATTPAPTTTPPKPTRTPDTPPAARQEPEPLSLP
jgi:putative drug exporter of the RND superfamily